MTEFADLGLSPTILQAIIDSGYTTATPIQEQAIPVALAGLDVLGIAQTGTGKTAAFTLPMIEKLSSGRAKARMPRALVIAPTRELADQVSLAFERYAKGTKLTWALLIGGVSFGDQQMKLDRGVDVLIATPGRLLDHFERGKLLLTGVQIMVVDEADRMLDMGFIPDIERIFKMTPAKKQTLFFSATMPPEITRLTQQFLNNPVRIEASRPATTGENITQHIVRIPTADPKAKRLALRALVGAENVRNGIVFCNRKSEVDIVAKSLKTHGFDAAPIHGDLDQSTRMRTLDAFRKGELKLLCASDVAARGLDIPDVSHVFNYDVPHHADDYVHRIGRTGRAGRHGDTFMIVTPADSRNLDKVLKLIGNNPAEVTLDLDWASAKTDPRHAAANKRTRERTRDPESRGRGRPASETSVAPMEPITVSELLDAEAAPMVETPRERPERARRAPRTPRTERQPQPEREDHAEAASVRPEREDRAERPVRAEREPRGDRPVRRPDRTAAAADRGQDRSRRPQGDDQDRQVKGFGADVPAFLRTALTASKAD